MNSESSLSAPEPQAATAAALAAATPGPIRPKASLLRRAKTGDQQALVTIIRQFLPEHERVYWTEYLGFHGWIFGRHSIGFLTERRAGDLTIGWFGEVIYQDGYLEYVNSGVVHQPSKLLLYILVLFALVGASVGGLIGVSAVIGLGWSLVLGWIIGALLVLILGVLLVNLVVRIYYAFNKCGLVLAIKEGIDVYVIADRKRLPRASVMYRMVSELRDERIKNLGHIG